MLKVTDTLEFQIIKLLLNFNPGLVTLQKVKCSYR